MAKQDVIMRCHVCTEYCPQEELACEIAKGRMWATQALVKYEQIGTAEEFKELKEKNTAKKPTDVRYFGEAGYYIGLCPTCKSGNNSEYKYCGDCGQKIDWWNKE